MHFVLLALLFIFAWGCGVDTSPTPRIDCREPTYACGTGASCVIGDDGRYQCRGSANDGGSGQLDGEDSLNDRGFEQARDMGIGAEFDLQVSPSQDFAVLDFDAEPIDVDAGTTPVNPDDSDGDGIPDYLDNE